MNTARKLPTTTSISSRTTMRVKSGTVPHSRLVAQASAEPRLAVAPAADTASSTMVNSSIVTAARSGGALIWGGSAATAQMTTATHAQLTKRWPLAAPGSRYLGVHQLGQHG